MKTVVIGGWAPSLLLFRKPLLERLVARGHRVTAIASDGTPEITAALAVLGVDYREIVLARAAINPIADLLTLAHLTRELRELEPDVVFAYTIKPVIYGNVAAALARVPRRYSMITGLGYTFSGQQSARRRLLRRVVAKLYRMALRGGSGLFLQNRDDHADLEAVEALPPTLRVTFVRGSGVDTEHYAVRPLPAGPTRFLFVGRLLREKGIVEYVELARRVRRDHRDVLFHVVGWVDPNPASVDRQTLDGWVREGAIEYLGEVADVRPALAAAHVLVLPSYREGTPRSVLEAMSMGRPAIVTDVPGCRETIVDGEHGFVVPLHDHAALVAAATRLIEDRALLEALGRAARARACDVFDARAVARHMVEVMGL